ncbi:hypothetical protein HDV00_005074 [Rhizophlyctis rosea]|nr:hypothetical protein HDV00_005074 [Rhizophlyctis rosea]
MSASMTSLPFELLEKILKMGRDTTPKTDPDWFRDWAIPVYLRTIGQVSTVFRSISFGLMDSDPLTVRFMCWTNDPASRRWTMKEDGFNLFIKDTWRMNHLERLFYPVKSLNVSKDVLARLSPAQIKELRVFVDNDKANLAEHVELLSDFFSQPSATLKLEKLLIDLPYSGSVGIERLHRLAAALQPVPLRRLAINCRRHSLASSIIDSHLSTPWPQLTFLTIDYYQKHRDLFWGDDPCLDFSKVPDVNLSTIRELNINHYNEVTSLDYLPSLEKLSICGEHPDTLPPHIPTLTASKLKHLILDWSGPLSLLCFNIAPLPNLESFEFHKTYLHMADLEIILDHFATGGKVLTLNLEDFRTFSTDAFVRILNERRTALANLKVATLKVGKTMDRVLTPKEFRGTGDISIEEWKKAMAEDWLERTVPVLRECLPVGCTLDLRYEGHNPRLT